MIIYLAIFLLFLIPVIRFDLMKMEGNKALWCGLEWIVLVLVAGLRYRVGGDTIVYMRLFEDYPTIGELSDFDFAKAKFFPGWYVFNSLFKTFGNSFTLFQISEAIIIQTCFFRFFRRYSPNGFFTCTLIFYFGYFCYFNMEVMREALCICIFLEAYPFLERRRFIPYFLLCSLALTIHLSAFIMFLLPLFTLFKKDRFWIWLALVLTIIFLLQVIDIATILLQIAFSDSIAALARGYMAKMADRTLNGIIIEVLTIVPFFIIVALRKHHGYTQNQEFGALLTLFVMAQTAGITIPGVNRFSNYVLPLGVVFIVNTFYENYWQIRSRVFSTLAIFATISIYCFNLSFFYLRSQHESLRGTHSWNRYVPYYSVVNPRMDTVRETMMANERAFDPTINIQQQP